MIQSRGLSVLLAGVVAGTLWAASSDYVSVRQKLDRIEGNQLKPGARVQLTNAELTAYAAHEAPAGVRNPKLEVTAPGVATGTAMVDFVKLQRSQGREPGWLSTMLLDGERPVSVTARIRSSNGNATVDVDRVQIGGFQIQGATLDFLIRNVLLPLYPDAAIGRPFALAHNIERLDVQPRGVGVVIGK